MKIIRSLLLNLKNFQIIKIDPNFVLLLLVIVFFVLLYSLSSIKQEKFMSAINSIKAQLSANAPLTGLSHLFKIQDSTKQKISIEDITIESGQCVIGFYTDAPAGEWLHFDDIELEKKK